MKYWLLSLLLLSLPLHASPLGSWKRVSNDSQDAKSMMTITTIENNHYVGTVARIYHTALPDELPLCRQCKGELKNKPIIGMQVLKELQQTDSVWTAKILNTDNGRWYSINIELDEANDQMVLSQTWWQRLFNPYKGNQLLGNSMSWQRAE